MDTLDVESHNDIMIPHNEIFHGKVNRKGNRITRVKIICDRKIMHIVDLFKWRRYNA